MMKLKILLICLDLTVSVAGVSLIDVYPTGTCVALGWLFTRCATMTLNAFMEKKST